MIARARSSRGGLLAAICSTSRCVYSHAVLQTDRAGGINIPPSFVTGSVSVLLDPVERYCLILLKSFTRGCNLRALFNICMYTNSCTRFTGPDPHMGKGIHNHVSCCRVLLAASLAAPSWALQSLVRLIQRTRVCSHCCHEWGLLPLCELRRLWLRASGISLRV